MPIVNKTIWHRIRVNKNEQFTNQHWHAVMDEVQSNCRFYRNQFCFTRFLVLKIKVLTLLSCGNKKIWWLYLRPYAQEVITNVKLVFHQTRSCSNTPQILVCTFMYDLVFCPSSGLPIKSSPIKNWVFTRQDLVSTNTPCTFTFM